jgi:hypothetical protein
LALTGRARSAEPKRLRLRRAFEKFGWATQVRWSKPERLVRKLKTSNETAAA